MRSQRSVCTCYLWAKVTISCNIVVSVCLQMHPADGRKLGRHSVLPQLRHGCGAVADAAAAVRGVQAGVPGQDPDRRHEAGPVGRQLSPAHAQQVRAAAMHPAASTQLCVVRRLCTLCHCVSHRRAAFDRQPTGVCRFEYDGQLNPHFSPGQFSLPVASIRAVLPEPPAPRLVHVSSAGDTEFPVPVTDPLESNLGSNDRAECAAVLDQLSTHVLKRTDFNARCFYMSDAIVCAGVTRPNRPGIDVEAEPPAVRMNNMLGGILTYKLEVCIQLHSFSLNRLTKAGPSTCLGRGSRDQPPVGFSDGPLRVQGENVVRHSGVPFAVVRPTALTEEPAGAELQLDQGDTIKVWQLCSHEHWHLLCEWLHGELLRAHGVDVLKQLIAEHLSMVAHPSRPIGALVAYVPPTPMRCRHVCHDAGARKHEPNDGPRKCHRRPQSASVPAAERVRHELPPRVMCRARSAGRTSPTCAQRSWRRRPRVTPPSRSSRRCPSASPSRSTPVGPCRPATGRCVTFRGVPACSTVPVFCLLHARVAGYPCGHSLSLA